MMEGADGALYTTNAIVCAIFGWEASVPLQLYRRHKEQFDSRSMTVIHAKEFDPLSVSVSDTNAKEVDPLSRNDSDAKEFLAQNKAIFGIKRLRKDMHLWTEDDILTFAFLAQSQRGLEVKRELKKFLKEQALKNYVPRQDWDQLLASYAALYAQNQSYEAALQALQAQFQELSARLSDLEQAKPALQATASAAGTALAAQRFTKNLRN
jgi:hypothetical protein